MCPDLVRRYVRWIVEDRLAGEVAVSTHAGEFARSAILFKLAFFKFALSG